MLINVKAVHHHFREPSFVMVAEQWDRGQYVLCVDNLGAPWHIALTEGLVVVSYKYRGFGAYDLNVCAKSMGKDDPTLDPIIKILISKGWSRGIIRMHFLEHEPLWNVIGNWVLSPIKSQWDGSREKYLITEAPTSTPRSTFGPNWAILVHLADNGFLKVCVGVPEIYESDQLGKLLRAIKSLPCASEMPYAHPAMLATG
ncbi:MAG: hypothetical protein HYX23_02315 [Candidatus Zambryskibacteria bacterium]|nr:hypothetical protein [Candidatus Zambryskibacteria bacterium]